MLSPEEAAQVDEDIQEEIQELKRAIKWVGDQLIDLQKQVILRCDWNSTEFCVTPVHFNHSAYNWEQIKFHLQNIHDNASLNVQLLQKEIFETFSKRLPSSTNLETLAEQLADQLSGLDPRGWFQSITHSIGSGTVTLMIVLVIIFVVYRCLSIRLANSIGQDPFYKYNKIGAIVRNHLTGGFLWLFWICHESSVPY